MKTHRSCFCNLPLLPSVLRGVLFIALLFCSGLVQAQGKPEIKAKSVNYVQAGRTTTVILFGENLTPNGIKASKPQMTVKLGAVKATEGEDKKKGSKEVILDIVVAADCPHENIELTLTQADGNKTTTQIPVVEPAASEVSAKKPNTSFAESMPLVLTSAMPSLAVTGNVEGDNPATFRFEGKAGETWKFTLFAGRGGSTLDPVLRVRDSKHHSLALAAGNPKQDVSMIFVVPIAGTYYLELMDEQSRGGGAFTYRLTAQQTKAK